MSTQRDHHTEPSIPDDSYLAEPGVRSWLTSTDHKRIALMYLASFGVVLMLGLGYALVLGLERAAPGSEVLRGADYQRALALHGVVMAFLVVVPAIPATLGNFVLPLKLGARNLAFPRLGRAALRLYWLGAAIALLGGLGGAFRGGWTFVEAYDVAAAPTSALWALFGVLLVSVSGLLNGLNAIVTLHKLRTTGLTFSRLPLFAWAAYAASVIAIVAPAPLAAAALLVAAERGAHIGVFDPALGGDPLIFRRLFWLHAQPALVAGVLWGMGIVGELLEVHARRPRFGGRLTPVMFLAVAFFSFFQGGSRLVTAGATSVVTVASSLFALLSFALVLVTLLRWVRDLRGGLVSFNAPTLFALAALVNLTVWVGSGIALSVLGVGDYLGSTMFEVAHAHYGLVGGTLTALLGGLYHWWPKLSGKSVDERLGKLAASGVLVGINLTFFGQFLAGLAGAPRGRGGAGHGAPMLSLVTSLGSWVLSAAVVASLVVLLVSLWERERASENPWGAEGLEWKTTSPPPADNFHDRPAVAGA